MNFVIIAASLALLIPNTYAIFAFKFVFGFACGCLIVASSLFLNETIPAESSHVFGFSTNFGVICGITLCLVLGFGLPTDPVE